MTKGTYPAASQNKFGEGNATATDSRDASFRSCLCVLLVFIGICLLILLVGLRWTLSKATSNDKDDFKNLNFSGKPAKLNEKFLATVPTDWSSTTEDSQGLPSEGTTVTDDFPLRFGTDQETTTSLGVVEGTSNATETTTIIPDDLTSTTELFGAADGNIMLHESTSQTPEEVLESSTISISTTSTEGEDANKNQEVTSFTSFSTDDGTTEPSFTPILSSTPSSTAVVEENSATTIVTTEASSTTVDARLLELNESKTEYATTPSTKGSEEITSTESWTSPEPGNPTCESAMCKSTAARILSLIDFSIDACEDFYGFACGGMQYETPPDSWERLSEQLYLINSSSPDYLQTFRLFYDTCMGHEYTYFDHDERVQKILPLINEVGTFLKQDTAPETLDLTKLFAKLILHGSHPLIDVDLDIDYKTTKFVFKITPPKSTTVLQESGRWSALSDNQKRCLYLQQEELQKSNVNLTQIYGLYLTCQKDHADYLESLQNVVQTLGLTSHFNQAEKDQCEQQLRTIIGTDILTSIDQLPPPGQMRQVYLTRTFDSLSIEDLETTFKLIKWGQLFNALTGQELDKDTKVQVYFTSYLRDLFKKLDSTVLWQFNNALISMYAHNLYINLVTPQTKQTRDNYCFELATTVFHDISSNMYMKSWSKPQVDESYDYLIRYFDLLKANLSEGFKTTTWLDEKSKSSVLTKLTNLKMVVNRESDIYNKEDYLISKYKMFNLEKSNFPHNVLTALEHHKRSLFKLHGKPFSYDYLWCYFIKIFDTKPTTLYFDNTIAVPLGMMTQFDQELPGYVTSARFGVTLAREITRHFDPMGKQFGVIISEESAAAYTTLKNIVEAEENLHLERPLGRQTLAFKANTSLSSNEKIIDDTALMLVMQTFDAPSMASSNALYLPWIVKEYDEIDIFFIAAAQEYCKKTTTAEYMLELFESELLPGSLRVENMMKDYLEFVTTFGCAEGSLMNYNEEKIRFPYLVLTDYEI